MFIEVDYPNKDVRKHFSSLRLAKKWNELDSTYNITG